MRAPIGDIVAAGAGDLATALLDECAQIARRQGFPPRDATLQRTRAMFTTAGSLLTASMLRDVERSAQTEVDHILGDLLRRGEDSAAYPVLRIAHAHLATYEAQRRRRESDT
jgi:2-dehydropantoate 2-reductase